MKLKQIILLLSAIITLSACNQTPIPATGDWQRDSLKLNKKEVETKLAKLSLKLDSTFESGTEVCSNSGDYTIIGNKLTLNMTKTDCQKVEVPVNTTYRYKAFNKEGKDQLILETDNLKAVYSR